jgi:hypothetical protein
MAEEIEHNNHIEFYARHRRRCGILALVTSPDRAFPVPGRDKVHQKNGADPIMSGPPLVKLEREPPHDLQNAGLIGALCNSESETAYRVQIV